jgi:erythromycin esterase-like protein
MEKSITEIVTTKLQELRTTFAAATLALDTERDKLEEESSEIRAASNELKLLLPAKAREAERAADVLLLAGKPAEAQAKRKEQQSAERAPAEMEQRCRAITVRCGQIEAEKEAIARRVFAEWYPKLRAALVAEQLESVTALDKARDGIARWAGERGLAAQPGGILKALWEDDLTASDRGPERPLFERLRIWFGGRQ